MPLGDICCALPLRGYRLLFGTGRVSLTDEFAYVWTKRHSEALVSLGRVSLTSQLSGNPLKCGNSDSRR